MFVGGTCEPAHVESFNKNMKALGVLESQWDPTCKKLVRRLLEEQDKVVRSYFVHKGGTRSTLAGNMFKMGRVCVLVLRAELRTLFLVPEGVQPAFCLNREEFHMSVRLSMHIDFL